MLTKLKRLILPAALVGAVWTGSVVISNASNSNQPGSVDDPLVTKSYLEEQLRNWTGAPASDGSTGGSGSNTGSAPTEAQIKQWIADEAAKLKNELAAGQPGSGTTPGTTTPGSASTITVIKLEADQVVYAGAGAEMIVRTGKTVAVSNDDGIPDVTAGKDLPAGTAIETNHLLVFPRDGRGVKPAADNTADIYIMIRGSYIVLDS